jgi:hypothetical protein
LVAHLPLKQEVLGSSPSSPAEQAEVLELADRRDLKSLGGNPIVRVQIPPSAPRGVAQWFSALGLGPRGRRFKSGHPDPSSLRSSGQAAITK